jgi:peptidoglycan/LPS O-acetylase OafA/YrhL
VVNHRPELDGLRALAVLLVIASHLAVPYLLGGWVGVDVFFVLSGYLITSILVREFHRTSSIALGHFYLRRVLRLYPALIAMLLVCAFWYRLFGESDTLNGYLHTAAYSGFYLQDIVSGYGGGPHGALGFTWSLALEEQFYLLWAPLLLLCLKRGWPLSKVTLALTLASTTALFVEWGRHYNGNALVYFRPETRANELFLGCLLATVLPRIQVTLADHRSVSNVFSWLGLAGLLGVELYGEHFSRASYYPVQEIWAGASAAVLIVGLSVGVNRSLVNRALSTRPAVSVGRISYGMYLWMIPSIILLNKYLASYPIDWRGFAIVALALIMLLASASYFLVERPCLSLKRRFEIVRTSPDPEKHAFEGSPT